MLIVTDPYLETQPALHDTMALPRQDLTGEGLTGQAVDSGPGVVPGFGPRTAGQPHANPEADAWEARYLMQRTRTRVAISVAVVASVVALGLGVVAWQLAQVSPLLSAASELAAGLGDENLAGEGLVADGPVADGSVSEDSSPEGSTPGGSAEPPDVVISDLTVPDEVKDLAAVLGITDVGQLLDLAVGSGLMTEEDAERLRTAVGIGALLQG